MVEEEKTNEISAIDELKLVEDVLLGFNYLVKNEANDKRTHIWIMNISIIYYSRINGNFWFLSYYG